MLSEELLGAVNIIISITVWTILIIFLTATVFWVVEMVFVGRARRGPLEHSVSDIEVRILTIDSEAVVQATVNALPDGFKTVRVISETGISVDGATVNVVPDSFSCEATRKGRAIEWARQTHPSDAEYILYLDEDTLLREFHGLPDSDIVQLSEQPIRSDSWIAYLAEIFRMGFQLEQAAFPNFRYPLYAWGGGFAVRTSVENTVTWNTHSLTEDTNFIWRAFADDAVDMSFLRVRALNQAPPSIRELIHQRRRWISGAARDSHLLPKRYQVLSLLRNAAWGLVTISPLLAVPVVTPIEVTLFPELYRPLLLVAVFGLFAWILLGYWYYGERVTVLAALLLVAPVLPVIHALGAFWALISPTTDFRVTEKVNPENVDDARVDEVDFSPVSSNE